MGINVLRLTARSRSRYVIIITDFIIKFTLYTLHIQFNIQIIAMRYLILLGLGILQKCDHIVVSAPETVHAFVAASFSTRELTLIVFLTG